MDTNDPDLTTFATALNAKYPHRRLLIRARDRVDAGVTIRARHLLARTALLRRLLKDPRVLAAFDAWSDQFGLTPIREPLIQQLDALATDLGLRSRAGLFDPNTTPPIDAGIRARCDNLCTSFVETLDQQTTPLGDVAVVVGVLLDALRLPRRPWLGLELLLWSEN